MINIHTSARYRLNKKQLKEYAQSQLEGYDMGGNAVLNIVLVGIRKMKEYSLKYKNENVALPVLSFSYRDDPSRSDLDNLAGEIVICYPQAVLLAAERNKKVEEIFKQLVEHGLQNIFLK